MKYPTLRYGNPNEFAHYVQGVPIRHVAQQLRRSERSVQQWLSGTEKMPWWVPEVIRLQHMEQQDRLRQMTYKTYSKMGLLSVGNTAVRVMYPWQAPQLTAFTDLEPVRFTLPLFPHLKQA
jgi:hypothetical protein